MKDNRNAIFAWVFFGLITASATTANLSLVEETMQPEKLTLMMRKEGR